MLVITLLTMGGATFLIGLVPTFEQVGWAAPVLLVILRFLQGFAVGGEWGGAMLIVVEHAPEKRRNFYASWPQTGVPVGLMLSTGVFAAFSTLPDEDFFSWGWRVPFLLSALLIAVGLFIRLRVLESPVFSQLKELGLESKTPLLEVLRHYPVSSVLAIGMALALINGFYIVTTFTLAYATEQLGVPRSELLLSLMLAAVAQFTGILTFANVADRIGSRRRAVALWTALIIVLLSYPYFWLIDTGTTIWIGIAMSAKAFAGGALYGVIGVLMAELFPARLRYSGISLGYQLAALLGGALAPVIATALVQWAGGASWAVASYVAGNAILTLMAVYLASDRYRVAIHDHRSGDRSPLAGAAAGA
jgi:MFS family permease